MSEKVKKKSKKGWILFIVLIMGALVFLGFYLGRVGFGNGKGGFFASLLPAKNTPNKTNKVENKDKLIKGFKFYFNHDKIIYQKKEISLETFKKYIAEAKNKKEIVELFFVDVNMTKGGYTKIKDAIGDMTIREVSIEPENMPK